MKDALYQMQKDQLERKLQLLLGTQKDWLDIYADWCAENDVQGETQACADHNINIFVR